MGEPLEAVAGATVPMAVHLAESLDRRGAPPRVALAEGDDPRVREAAEQLPALGVQPVLLTSRDELSADRVPLDALAAGAAGAELRRLGRAKGWSEESLDARSADPVHLAAAAVRAGIVDAAVAGSTQPTAHVLRAGLRVLGLQPGCTTLSSSFLMRTREGGMLGFGDCAVVPEPDAEQLADIALATAATYQACSGQEPIVAMLSFSTRGSASHDRIDTVRAATALVRERRPDLAVDGELQFDAAFAAGVGASKAPGSPVAGRANVFIFPNLDAGNLGYKIAQYLGGCAPCGPLIQGLTAPLHDLSRGCTPADVASVAVASALQVAAATAPDSPPGALAPGLDPQMRPTTGPCEGSHGVPSVQASTR